MQAGSSMRFSGTLEGRKSDVEAHKVSKAAWPGSPGGGKSTRGRERRAAGDSPAEAAGAAWRSQAPAAAGRPAAAAPGASRRWAAHWRAGHGRRPPAADSSLSQVLERLCIAKNRHSRVHPLELPPSQLSSCHKQDPGEKTRGRGPTWVPLKCMLP